MLAWELVVKTGELVELQFVALWILYCCDIRRVKDITAVCYDVVVKGTRVSYMVTADKIISGKLTGERLNRNTKMVRNRFLEISTNKTGIVKNGNEGSLEEKRALSRQVEKKFAININIFS